jgi:creatinine amidohydrolase
MAEMHSWECSLGMFRSGRAVAMISIDSKRSLGVCVNFSTFALEANYMRKIAVAVFALLLFVSASFAQTNLSPQWEELTAADFAKAVQLSRGVCVLPIGIVEKHGPHLPLGTDLLNVRKATSDAAALEYAPIFPPSYFGQIFEARQQPGTIAYSLDLQLRMLQETTDEMARNGCKKIVIVNGHGGNESLLPLFAQSQLAKEHDYVIYVFGLPRLDVQGRPPLKDSNDMHGGESETSHMMANRPELVHQDRANQESGADQNRQHLPQSLYTGIWWYAKFPNHYSGDGSHGRKDLGEFDMKTWAREIADAVKAVKADEDSPRLQKQFYEDARHPLETKQ